MKQRIDLYLVEQGYFQSREQAQRAIMAGEVVINDKPVEKPGQMIAGDTFFNVQINRDVQQFVSRGGHKLVKALSVFQLSVTGKVCLDAGASTGGFTDCLLQSGAKHVYAIDVGYGQLAWKLRQDPRVTVFERENIRYFDGGRLPEKPGLITADLSFISLGLVLPKFHALTVQTVVEHHAGCEMVTLIKPQFEAGKDKVGKKGVVRDKETHLEILERLKNKAPGTGWFLADLTFSPLLGPEGNIEYLGLWRLTQPDKEPEIDPVVDCAWQELKGSLETNHQK